MVILTISYWTEYTKISRKNWKVLTLTRSNNSGKLCSWGDHLCSGMHQVTRVYGKVYPLAVSKGGSCFRGRDSHLAESMAGYAWKAGGWMRRAPVMPHRCQQPYLSRRQGRK